MDDSGYMFNESIIILHFYQPVIFHHPNAVFVTAPYSQNNSVPARSSFSF